MNPTTGNNHGTCSIEQTATGMPPRALGQRGILPELRTVPGCKVEGSSMPVSVRVGPNTWRYLAARAGKGESGGVTILGTDALTGLPVRATAVVA